MKTPPMTTELLKTKKKHKKKNTGLEPEVLTPVNPLDLWYSPEKKTIGKSELFKWLKETAMSKKFDEQQQIKLFVGTDSNIMGLRFRFVSVVCLYVVGKGGNYFYSVDWKPRELYRGNQQKRMFEEVAVSIELANEILDVVGLKPEIHVDASPKEAKEFTSSFSDNLKSYVISSGYDCKLKPESIAAYTIADKHTR
jgi:predicted RNase H-related nuclease YkuK (DUF458 family)